MSVAEATRIEQSPSVAPPGEERLALFNVSWDFYEAFLTEIGNRSSVRLTYDRGKLEIMAPSYRHEYHGTILGLLIRILAEETDVPIRGGGSVTLKRKDLKRGLEPDECFYIANVDRMKKLTLDLRRDPPPDLAIEVDITSSSLDRMGIYAALGTPEIWRFDGKVLRVYQLRPDGNYEECQHSPSFPSLPLKEVTRYVHMTPGIDETALTKKFRKWVRQRLLPRRKSRKRPQDG